MPGRFGQTTDAHLLFKRRTRFIQQKDETGVLDAKQIQRLADNGLQQFIDVQAADQAEGGRMSAAR
ncbi:MAG: hypothetical protein U0452_12270 [Anaerolineae bacterium]